MKFIVVTQKRGFDTVKVIVCIDNLEYVEQIPCPGKIWDQGFRSRLNFRGKQGVTGLSYLDVCEDIHEILEQLK